MARKKAPVAAARKLSDNKTTMHHEFLQKASEPPELAPEEANALLTEEKKSPISRLKNLFGRKKKEAPQAAMQTAGGVEPLLPPSLEETQKSQQAQEEEPAILKEIDQGMPALPANSAEPELTLWLNDGRVVKDLEELCNTLQTMKERVFLQHKEKNDDMSQWVSEILGNPQLGAEMATAQNRKDMIRIIKNHQEHQTLQASTSLAATAKTKATKKKKDTNVNMAELSKQDKSETLPVTGSLPAEISSEGNTETAENNLAERERKLALKEQQLEAEEEAINKRRMELANKRYQLIKERGAIERERFEQLMRGQQHTGLQAARRRSYTQDTQAAMQAGTHSIQGDRIRDPTLLSPTLEKDYNKERILQMTKEARMQLRNGNATKAQRILGELKQTLPFANLSAREAKTLEYEILEIEADIKLATLV